MPRANMLIDAAELNNIHTDDNLRLFDAAVFLHPGKSGYTVEKGLQNYLQGHIPGAAYLDLVEALSDTTSGLGFTLPDAAQLAAGIGAHGISNNSPVVVYSSGHLMWATRAWWLLSYAGHANVRVLDGGLQAWRDAGLPLTTAQHAYAPATFTAEVRPERFADMDTIAAATADGATCTVNALSAALYEGTGEFHYGRRGHIPGSQHLFYDDVLHAGRFLPDDELRNVLQQAGMLAAPRVITYCGGGIAATVHAFACVMAGAQNVAVYDGSMSEWIRAEQPLTTGTTP